MEKKIGVVIVLSLLVLSMSFSSASWFSDVWDKISGNGITGNAVVTKTTNSGVSCSIEGKIAVNYKPDGKKCSTNGCWEKDPKGRKATSGACGPVVVKWTNEKCVVSSWDCGISYSAGYCKGELGYRTKNIPSCGSSKGSCSVGKTEEVRFESHDVNCVSTPSTPTCTSFSYSDWSECVDGQQIRTVISSSPSNCQGGSPVTIQGCISPDLTPPIIIDSYPKNGDVVNYTDPFEISVKTNEPASCRLDKENLAYEDMWWSISSTEEGLKHILTLHSSDIPTNQNLTVHIKCMDKAGNINANPYIINFLIQRDESTVEPICYDSDGGLNYYEKGTISSGNLASGLDIREDTCITNSTLREMFCSDNLGTPQLYECPNGCSDGACIPEDSTPKTCRAATGLIQNPKQIDSEGYSWIPTYNYSYHLEDERNYYTSWNYVSQGSYDTTNQYIYSNVIYLSGNSNYPIEDRLEKAINSKLCDKQEIYTNENESQTVYVCKNIWRLAEEAKKVSPEGVWNSDNDVVVLWFNGNRLFNFEFSMNNYNSCYSPEDCDRMENQNHMRKQEDLIRFIDNLIDNKGEYVGTYLDYRSQVFVKYFLNACPSQVSSEGYLGSWSCKMEPVICPPHGEQTQTCVRYNPILGKEETQTYNTQCNPGICSGCMVPRWFGSNSNNVCMPYGARFEQQTSWKLEEVFINESDKDGLTVGNSERYSTHDLLVYPNDTALFTIYEDAYGNEINETPIYLEEGKTYDLNFMRPNENLNFTLYIEDIFYNSSNYESSYISAIVNAIGYTQREVPDSFNAFCGFNGKISEQKGNGDSCQNNYECESNECRSGVCVNSYETLAKQAGLLSRIWCRLSTLFSTEEAYNQCIARN